MSKPRVFVSSTYYDLKHLRSSLENFIESLGFESILSEKGDIAYTPEVPLDESCYREASSSDIFVLIVGGRYGAEASHEGKKPNRSFYERYNSITMEEYRHAIASEVPTYILIESSVYAEYRTFLKNKNKTSIQYAHVDSVNIFLLIEHILNEPKNNPVQTFERYSEIEKWLREQWAGLFKELLQRLSGQQQLTSLSKKISELGQINQTLRKYMETIISEVAPSESKHIIEKETKRLETARGMVKLEDNTFYRRELKEKLSVEGFANALRNSKSFDDFSKKVALEASIPDLKDRCNELLREYGAARNALNEARKILGLSLFNY